MNAARHWLPHPLLIAMLGFVGTVVMARFVGRGDVIDHD